MVRALRIEFPHAVYHVTARGNARKDIFLTDSHRRQFLDYLAKTAERYNWLCHAYCLMSNHYHLLIETIDPTLSGGMKYLNGRYAQYFNQSQRRVGHVFQGRYKGILVEKEGYLLELSRYIVLNPVRAKMVARAEDWPWSSCPAALGQCAAHHCLHVDWLLNLFGQRLSEARKRYHRFIEQGIASPSPLSEVRNQIYLGSDEFIERSQGFIESDQSFDAIPKKQRRSAPKPLSQYQSDYEELKEGMAAAYLSGHYTLKQIGDAYRVSHTTVSRAVKRYELKQNTSC